MKETRGYKTEQRSTGKSRKKRSCRFTYLAVSVLILILSVAGFTVGTYSWFTGIATADGSGIESGILDIEIYSYEEEVSAENPKIDIDKFDEEFPVESAFVSKWSNIADERTAEGRTIFQGELEPGKEITEYFAITNEGDTFSEYGITFTVEKVNEGIISSDEYAGDSDSEPIENDLPGAPPPAGEADISEVIQVFFSIIDKETGKPGPYTYIGRLSELQERDTDIEDTEEVTEDEVETEPPEEEIDVESLIEEEKERELQEETKIHEELDAIDNHIIRGLLLTKDEAEGKGYAGQHTYEYDPEKDDEEFIYSIERLRQHLMGNDNYPSEREDPDEDDHAGDAGPEEQKMPGDYKQFISVKLRLPNKLYAAYQNCSVKIGVRQIATQRAREICMITAYGQPDDEGKLIGYVTGGGTYHKSIRADGVPEEEFTPDKVTLTPVPETGYKFSRWRYGLTSKGESAMQESQEEELEAALDNDYTYIAEFVKESEYHEGEVDPDWDDDEKPEEFEEEEEENPFG